MKLNCMELFLMASYLHYIVLRDSQANAILRGVYFEESGCEDSFLDGAKP